MDFFFVGLLVLVFVLVAVVMMCTSWRGVGFVLRRPGGRPGPGWQGFGALAGQGVFPRRCVETLGVRGPVTVVRAWSVSPKGGADPRRGVGPGAAGCRRRGASRSTGQRPAGCGPLGRSSPAFA